MCTYRVLEPDARVGKSFRVVPKVPREPFEGQCVARVRTSTPGNHRQTEQWVIIPDACNLSYFYALEDELDAYL